MSELGQDLLPFEIHLESIRKRRTLAVARLSS